MQTIASQYNSVAKNLQGPEQPEEGKTDPKQVQQQREEDKKESGSVNDQ